tara:strand:- start:1477 stop:2325 length:849 start_codon:yes stop_codon:yes gene_type:complete
MISITIPTYNRAPLITRAILSIKKQSFKDWELLIVDDGSTDNTSEIIKPFLNDERIRYIFKENSGAAHSRNVGVENSNFQYITFLDSDDEAKEDWLEKIYEEIEVDQPDLICCGCEIIDEKGILKEVKLPDAKPELFGNLKYKMTNGGVFVLKKEMFNRVGGYDANLKSGQHTELSFRIIPEILDSKGLITNIEESLIKIHIHLGERIRGNAKAKYLGSKRTLEKHSKFFENRKLAKSLYSGVLAYNASEIGERTDARKYSIISFRAAPSFKRFLRILKYSV